MIAGMRASGNPLYLLHHVLINILIAVVRLSKLNMSHALDRAHFLTLLLSSLKRVVLHVMVKWAAKSWSIEWPESTWMLLAFGQSTRINPMAWSSVQ